MDSQEDHTSSLDATSESGAPSESEERTKQLLAAYQGTLEVAEDLPAVVCVRWGDRGLGHFLKVPYFRWFLRYFLTHHIHKRLSALNRRLHAIAALAKDPDVASSDVVCSSWEANERSEGSSEVWSGGDECPGIGASRR